jgi:type II secretory pathway pseudopilin PulG
MARPRKDLGETLVEIVLTVVIVGVAVSALVSGLGTAAAAGATQRSAAEVDTVMRNYAEAIKSSARSCVVGGTFVTSFTPPSGFTATMTPTTGACPAVNATQLLTLRVAGPRGVEQTMDIRVRTP